jgi:hypothetical protein
MRETSAGVSSTSPQVGQEALMVVMARISLVVVALCDTDGFGRPAVA